MEAPRAEHQIRRLHPIDVEAVGVADPGVVAIRAGDREEHPRIRGDLDAMERAFARGRCSDIEDE